MSQVSLKKNFVWAFVGNIVNAFCMWLLLVLLTKLGTVEVVGLFGISQAVSVPISMLLNCKLRIVQVTDAQNDYDFSHYYALKLITAGLAIIITVIIGFAFYSLETALVISVLGIGYAVIAVREVFLAVMQKSERMDKVSISNILLGFLTLVLFGTIYLASKSLILSILGLIVARLIIVLSHDIPVSRSMFFQGGLDTNKQRAISAYPLFDKKVWHLAKFAAPLGVVAWLTSLLTSIPRLVLDKSFGKEEVGYFTAMSSLLVVGTIVITALGQSASPRLAKYFFKDKRSYLRLLGKLLLIGAIMGILGVTISYIFGRLILTLLFTKAYAEHSGTFVGVIIAGAVLILFSFMNIGLTATRKFNIQLLIYGVTTGTCVVSSLLLIPSHGMNGAVWTIVSCYLVGLLSCSAAVLMAVKKNAPGPK